MYHTRQDEYRDIVISKAMQINPYSQTSPDPTKCEMKNSLSSLAMICWARIFAGGILGEEYITACHTAAGHEICLKPLKSQMLSARVGINKKYMERCLDREVIDKLRWIVLHWIQDAQPGQALHIFLIQKYVSGHW
jgi:hypothetical protein